MKKSNHSRPKCRHCGKQLVEQWHPVEDFWINHFGTQPLKTKPPKYPQFGDSIESGFFGHYGKDDCDNFCSYRCGFQWANRIIRG